MLYMAYDGEVFNDETECLEHEHELDKAKEEVEKAKRVRCAKLKDLGTRYKKISKEFSSWADDATAYIDEYGHYELSDVCSEIDGDKGLISAIDFLINLGY